MNILIIGNLGYIGPVAVRFIKDKYPDYRISGFDIGYFIQQYSSNGTIADTLLHAQYFGDVRKFDEQLLEGVDAVIYLAAISNDPMGNVYEQATLDINYHAAIDIAKKSKAHGVSRFIFASSCSVYGYASDIPRSEESEVNPLTSYAKSKVYAERDLESLANENFVITCHRFATACGFSDRLRLDLVLNDFVAAALTERKISILSDGNPWRPLIHVRDMANAMDWSIHRKNGGNYLVINTGSNAWNYQVKELAEAVKEQISNTQVSINPDAQPDKRSYKVNFDLFRKLAPEHQPQVSLQNAVGDLMNGLQNMQFEDKNFRQSNYIRLKVIQHLIEKKVLNHNLVSEWH